MDGRSQKRQTRGMRPQPHPQHRAPLPTELAAGSGDLLENSVDIARAGEG